MRDEAEHKGDSGAVGLGARRCRDAEGVKEPPRIPFWRWLFWAVEMAVGIVVFYILLTPIWIGLRALAWAAEFRARRRSAGGQSPPARSG